MNPPAAPSAKIQLDNEPIARILLVGGSPWMRLALETVMEDTRWLGVCENTGMTAQAREICEKRQPDLAVIDLELPDGGGLALLRDFVRLQPRIRILAFGEREDSSWVTQVFQAGAWGYLSKQDEPREMPSALWRMVSGERMVGRRCSQLAIGNLTAGRQPRQRQDVEALSRRELDVFSLIARNLGPTEIARRLGIEVKTVETHFQRIKRKLDVPSGTVMKQRAAQWLRDAGVGASPGTVKVALALAAHWLLASGGDMMESFSM